MTPASLRRKLLRCDVSSFAIEDVKAFRRVLPRQDEIALLFRHARSEELGPADKLCFELIDVPILDRRLSTFVLAYELDLALADVQNDLRTLHAACRDVQLSAGLRRLLRLILQVGNALNAGSSRGNAKGITLDSFLKLRDVRSPTAAAAPTLLHFIGKLARQQQIDATSVMVNELPQIEAASRLSTDTLKQKVHEMVSGIRDAQKALEAYKALPAAQIPKEDRFRQMVEIFLQRAVPAVETLSRQAKKVEAEANSLVSCFGESPQETKPESVFDTIAQFLADLRRADAETQAIEAAAAAVSSSQAMVGGGSTRDCPSENALPPAIAGSDSQEEERPPVPSVPSQDRGQLDAALRDLRNGIPRRDQSVAERPLSRIFLSS